MIDKYSRKLIDPPLNRIGHLVSRTGLSANTVTWIGLGVGVAAAVAVVYHAWITALILILLNRLLDGLDGAVARASSKSDLGGYLDIVFDFFFYGGIPTAFILANPDQNAVAGGLLLFSFYANGSTFLAFAILAEKLGIETDAQGSKSLYYLGGLAEGTETVLVFCLMCLFPDAFAILAILFAVMCYISSVARVVTVIGIMKSRSP